MLPILWKLLIGDINLVLAVIITISGGACLMNIAAIYTIMSICRICLYHEFSWFMEMDQRKMSRVITTTVFLFWVVVGILLCYRKYTSEDHLGYTSFLISNISCKKIKFEYVALPPLIIIVFLSSSFLLECYLAIKIKRLPWFSLKSVTVGHLVMGAGLSAIYIQFSGLAMYVIMMPLAFLTFQFLYFLKYRDHAIKVAKMFFLNSTNRINPDEEGDNLNDFGIFVGPQNANNSEINEMRVFSISSHNLS